MNTHFTLFLPMAVLALWTMQVLFYEAGFMAFLMQRAHGLIAGLSWAFVVLRVGHSLVLLSYNKVAHQLALFALGNGVVAVIWCVLLYRLLSS
jgi:hypothetical protein